MVFSHRAMACIQQVRTSQDTQLLPNQVLTDQQSLVVIKKLLAITVSGITYLRGLFPEKAYGSKHVEDQKVMIIREERSCPGANQIVQWMQGCFDAIQKKYLRTVILSIYTDPEHPEKVTEFYQFRIQYTSKGAHMDVECNNNNVSMMSCGNNTKKAIILLVRKLYTLMQNLGPLPDNVCLNMKLAYYEDVTPVDYQPPGFKECDGDTMMFEKEPVKLTMGEVVTPFHTVKLDMATERQRLEQAKEESDRKEMLNLILCQVDDRAHEKWVLKLEQGGVLSQSRVMEELEKTDNEIIDLDNTEIKMSCNEKIENCVRLQSPHQVNKITEKDATGTETVDMKRTRSGRVIRSMTVTNLTVNKKAKAKEDRKISRYEIPNSQETPSSSASTKKRKISEPKQRY